MPQTPHQKNAPPTGRLRPLWRSAVTRPLSYRGATPKRFVFAPESLQIGDPLKAEAMMRGRFDLAGHSVKVERSIPWRAEPPSEAWEEALHGFGWLNDLRAADSDAVRSAARRITEAWLQRHARRGETPWRPAVLGDRIVAWCQNARFLLEGAEERFRASLLRSLAAQSRFASAAMLDERLPLDRVRAALGPAYVALCVSGHEGGRASAIRRVVEQMGEAVYADGMVRSGSPSDLFQICASAVELRKALIEAGQETHAEMLTLPIRRMLPSLRMLRMGDGGLAMLHGGRVEEAEAIDRVLAAAHDSTPARKEATDCGIMRLSAGGSVVVFNAGDAPSDLYAATKHSAPLSISFSSRRQRLLVNCGSAAHLAPEWQTACRSAAAHSTLILDKKMPGRFDGKASTAPRPITDMTRAIDRRAESDPSGRWALAGHDGYSEEYGLVHFRRLFLGSDGNDFRGEDTLTLTQNGARLLARARAAKKTPDGPVFALRFHLHPDLWVSHDEDAVELKLQSGEIWRFLQSGGEMRVEDSLYIPAEIAPIPAKQIVIRSVLGDEDGLIRWAFKRIQ